MRKTHNFLNQAQGLVNTPPFFHIKLCHSLNYDELIHTSLVSVRALNRTQ